MNQLTDGSVELLPVTAGTYASTVQKWRLFQPGVNQVRTSAVCVLPPIVDAPACTAAMYTPPGVPENRAAAGPVASRGAR